MNALDAIKALGPIDAKGVRRDSMLKWLVIAPVILALLGRWGLPLLTEQLISQFDFDLTVYYPLVNSCFFLLLTPPLFGMAIGFLLLDERDDRTLTALQVTPLSAGNYFAYRIIMPIIISVIMTVIVFKISGLSALRMEYLLLSALLAAPLAPIYALSLGSFAENKVQGFALTKASGVFLLLPVISYFVPQKWQFLFGIVPTYWPVKYYWMLYSGEPLAWLYFLIGLIYQVGLIVMLVRHFDNIMHR